jgi:uncharacterized membrane protein YqhA
VIAGIVMAALGAGAMAVALIELLAVMFDSMRSVRSLVRRVTGRSGGGESHMEQAMQWVQVVGLFLVGCVLMIVGISVGSS